MSESGDKPETVEPPGAGPPRYPLPELRRCIELSFSAGELSKFAEPFGVFLARDGGVEKGARTLVKALDARGGLGPLVEALRRKKPLVEWPEPLGEASSTAPEAAPQPAWRPPAKEAAPPSKAPLIDPYAGAPEPEPGGWPSWAPWAGIFAGGLLLGGIAVWLLAREPEGAPEGSGTGPVPVAALAAGHLRESVGMVAKTCQAPADADSARTVLAEAFRRCARPIIRPGLDLSPPLPPPPPPAPEPVRPLGARPLPKGPPGAGCLDACHRAHAACKASECGQEPASGAEYAEYQRCLNGCLSKYSQCRLRCP